MPYIKQEDRKRFDPIIWDVEKELMGEYLNLDPSIEIENPIKYKELSPGELNYVISKIIWDIFDKSASYSLGNELVGVLECVKQEFIRRRLNQYEDGKIVENGDL